MALIGYARVSTEDQTPLPQADELRAAGCRDIHEEQAPGASRSRPVLARVPDRAKRIDADDRQLAIVAGITGAAPDMTLQAICDRLEAMRERTPRGRARWQPTSVRMLLEKAKTQGLL